MFTYAVRRHDDLPGETRPDLYSRVRAVLNCLGADPADCLGPVTDVYAGDADAGDPDAVLVAGYWNTPRHASGYGAGAYGRVADALSALGAKIVWQDEYVGCSNCYRAIRIAPTHYGWTPGYIWDDYGPICLECISSDLEPYIGPFLNDPRRALPAGIDPESVGFVMWEPDDPKTYETGWHAGQDDDPAAVLAEIREQTDDDVIFQISGSGQFDIRWHAYVRPDDYTADGGR